MSRKERRQERREERDADPNLRVEEDKPPDPIAPDLLPAEDMIGRVDEFSARIARESTWDGRGRPWNPDDEAPVEGKDLGKHVHRTRETGRGSTVTLEADVDHGMGVGDEVWLHVPMAGRRGWTWSVEGDERCVDVEERAEIIEGTDHMPPPDGTLFVVRAEGRGRAAVRFEPIDDDAGVPPRRLRLTVG